VTVFQRTNANAFAYADLSSSALLVDTAVVVAAMLIAPKLGAAENSARGAQDGPNEGREGGLETDTEADVEVDRARRYR
jgi:hypothetical protein